MSHDIGNTFGRITYLPGGVANGIRNPVSVKKRFIELIRSQELDKIVHYYNNERGHLSLGGMPPVQRRIQYFESVTDVLR